MDEKQDLQVSAEDVYYRKRYEGKCRNVGTTTARGCIASIAIDIKYLPRQVYTTSQAGIISGAEPRPGGRVSSFTGRKTHLPLHALLLILFAVLLGYWGFILFHPSGWLLQGRPRPSLRPWLLTASAHIHPHNYHTGMEARRVKPIPNSSSLLQNISAQDDGGPFTVSKGIRRVIT